MTLMTTCTISSCSDESFGENSNGYGKLKFEAILPGSNGTSTRTVYVQDQYGKLKSGWESNDRISVYGFASGTYTFTNPDIDKSTDDISRWSNSEAEYQREEDLVAVYPALPINNDGIVEMDFSNQDGTLENLKNYDLMVSDKVPYKQTEVKFQMVRKNVFLRIDVDKTKYKNDPTGITITITGSTGINKASYNINSNTYRLSGTSTNITFTNSRSNVPESDGYYLFYIAVPCIQNSVPITRIEIKKVVKNGNREQTISDSRNYSNLKMNPGYIYSTRLANIADWGEKALLNYGDSVNSRISELVGNASNVRKIIFEVNSTKKVENYSQYKDLHFEFLGFNANLYAVHEGNGVVVIFTSGNVIYYNNAPSGMFKDFSNLEEIENLAIVKMDDGSIAQDIRDLSKMFYGCKSLKKIDLSSFVTNSVGDFTSMFEGCNSLTRLDISSFNTADAMSEIVRGLMKSKYDIGLFQSIYKNMNRMFANCSNIKELNLGKNFNLTYFYTDPLWNRTSNDWIKDSFVGTPNNISIKTTQEMKDQMTYRQRLTIMGLTNEEDIDWINVVNGQPLQ